MTLHKSYITSATGPVKLGNWLQGLANYVDNLDKITCNISSTADSQLTISNKLSLMKDCWVSPGFTIELTR